MKTKIAVTTLIVSLVALVLVAPQAWAGCACDHPVPCPSPVLPGFASPGDTVKLTGSGFATAAEGNEVAFSKGKTFKESKDLKQRLHIRFGEGVTIDEKAELQGQVKAGSPDTTHLRVAVPRASYDKESKFVGPMKIRVKNGKDVVQEYEDQLIYLSRPLVLEEGEGHYIFSGYPVAVDSSGVLFIPLDLSQIEAAMNFAVYVDNLPLDFDSSDVLIFNKDAFNLNLFTLDVEGYERHWGNFYGAQTISNSDPNQSDILTYWRHDFHRYHEAHAPGGEYYAHTVNEDGYRVHPDGTLHVDHDRLVVAVSGYLRDPKHPDDPSKMSTLKGGQIKNADIHILQLLTDDAQAFQHLSWQQQAALSVCKLATPTTKGFYSFPDVLGLYNYLFLIGGTNK